MSFLDKIKLINKKVYILGGFGLIGSKVVINTLSVGAEVIILDIKKKQIQTKSFGFHYLIYQGPASQDDII